MAETEFSVEHLARAIDAATVETKREVAGLVATAATAFARELFGQYPIGPTKWYHGQLRPGGMMRRSIFARAGTKRMAQEAAIALTWYARAYAPHVHFFEAGTRDRRDATRANAKRGHVEGRDIFIPLAQRIRGEMLAQAAAVVQRGREL